MLESNVIMCIRETMAAELPPRDKNVRATIQATQRKLHMQGLAQSGNAIVALAQIGCDELSVRSEIIWNVIQRCHSTFGSGSNDSLLADLKHEIEDLITREASGVLSLLGGVTDSFAPQVQSHIPDAIRVRRDELIIKFKNEARFYVQSIARSSKTDPGGVVIHGNVGAVQTGAYAQAHINLDVSGGPRLIEALEKLQAAIMEATEMNADQRDESAEVVNDLIVATRAPKPNGSKLLGLMSGLASTIRTVASLRPAWEFVRDNARMMGIPI